MAKSIVFKVVERLGSLLSEDVKQNIVLALNLEEEIRKMAANLQDIKAVLQDAETKQFKDASVRQWLSKLKDVAYDIDDVLDEWDTANLKSEIEKEEDIENAPVLKKIRYSISSFASQSILYYNIACKIKDLNVQLDCIAMDKDRYKLGLERGVEEPKRQITASFIDKEQVYGRFQEIKILSDMLLRDNINGKGSSLHAISIVGMGGIGKTTLAQLVYNQREVECHFDKRIWICVSEPFDEVRILKEILEAFKGETLNILGKDYILQKIQSNVLEKKVLLVLDDVWTEDATELEQLKNSLKCCFKCCSFGSKILITTRKERVAILMGIATENIFQLRSLSQEECLSLLRDKAFHGRTREECEMLEDISAKIAEKCQGLPLVAKVLGGLLRFRKTIEQWQSVLDSKIWELEEAERYLFPPLFLSYNELPLALRRCISYCAVFPKDKILNKDELIKLWMSQDYWKGVQGKEMEMVGEEYFDELMMRSFFQDFKRIELDSGSMECKIHDIVHDFLRVLTKTECLMLENNDFEDLGVDSLYEKARHVTLICKEAVRTDHDIYHFRKLRSLIVDSSVSMSLPKLFDQLTCLRALNLSNSLFGNSIKELPDQLGKLVHLRYLNLKRNRKLEKLPESLCELCNLQTLNLTWCDGLRELPCGIGKLINMRHLKNEKTDLNMMAMPAGMGRLTCLRTLKVFIVTDGFMKSSASTFGDLGNLKHLRGYLKISGLGSVYDVTEAKKAELHKKEGLRGLILDFKTKESFSESSLETNDELILKDLKPPPGLEKIELWYYTGHTIFPSWLMELTKLKHVFLGSCFHLKSLPPLGILPSLESLFIGDMKRVKEVGVEFLGVKEKDLCSYSGSSSSYNIAFRSLKHLEFHNMPNWDSWTSFTTGGEELICIMPHLCSLTIDFCPKLRELPCYIYQNTSLTQLDISQSPNLSERYRKETGEDWKYICHIPSIIIDGLYMLDCSDVEEFGVLQLEPLHSSFLSSNIFHEAFQQD